MPLNADALLAHHVDDREQVITDTDVMLFALSIGLGRDPLDLQELPYVFEEGLKAFPTLPIVLGHPGPWMADPKFGINRQRLVYGSQRLEVHGRIAPGAPFLASNRVLELVDKGADIGGIIILERELRDKKTGALLARMESGIFCRADGGFGGPRQPSRRFRSVPSRIADASVEMKTEPNQALWYRLNGDRNPLHASPTFASKAGFPRPILHGLCTYSVVAHGLMKLNPDKSLRTMECRFSDPVYPGESIRVEVWEQPGGAAFRACIAGRGAVVLDQGFVEFSELRNS